MSKGKRSGYLKAASRFLGLAAGAEDEADAAAAAASAATGAPGASESDEEDEEDEEEGGKKKGKNKGGKDCPAAEDDEDSDDEESRAAEDDEDEEDEKDEKKKAAAQARAAERARWAAVLSSDEAKGRASLACSLLADTNMGPDKIRAALLTSPVEARQGLAARMAAVPRTDIGSAPAATGPDPTTPKGRAAVLMAAYDKATGGKA